MLWFHLEDWFEDVVISADITLYVVIDERRVVYPVKYLCLVCDDFKQTD